jgi:hypothetical protein
MLVLREATAHPGLQASHYTTNLAFRLLGARHDWASPDCAKRIQQSPGVHCKFTKWIEVKPVTCPKADRVLDFLDELVHC